MCKPHAGVSQEDTWEGTLEDTMELLFIMIAFILFAIVAHLWGADSREKLNSSEWERRRSAARWERYIPNHM